MATMSCLCCRTAISADMWLCYDCSGRPQLPPGSVLIEYATEPSAGCHHYERRIADSITVIGRTVTDERLAEYEATARRWIEEGIGPIIARRVMTELLAEVRRLRRENRLLHLSRGTLSAVGGD